MENHLNLYEILGLSPNCTQNDIHKAYIEMSKKQIPDSCKATEKYKPIIELVGHAFNILNNPYTRKDYDKAHGNKIDPKLYNYKFVSKAKSYDTLNEKEIEDGDVIIGKVKPIKPIVDDNEIQIGFLKELTGGDAILPRPFKDSSQYYKSNIPNAVDKVYDNLNADGYEIKKVRLRSERVPIIGDKFCSKAGQMGTIGLQLYASDMPFHENGMVPDIIINPESKKIWIR